MKIPVWKLFLLCVMLISIPLKGVAGVAVAVCDIRHHSLYQTIQVKGMVESGASHKAAGEHSHHHHESAAGTDAGNHFSLDSSDHKCSACGFCCVSTAMASGPLTFIPPFGDQTAFPEPRIHLASPVLNGLDRPPQVIPA